MDCLINNKDNWSKLLDDSLTTTERSRRAGFSRSIHVTSFVFCLPLSWLQSCDIYFGIKQFIQHWYNIHFRTGKNKTTDAIITNIDIENLNFMMEKIENAMVNGDVNGIGNEEKNFLESVLQHIKSTLTIVLPCSTKLNNFIDFYSSIYEYNHKKRQEYVEEQEERDRILISLGGRPPLWRYQFSPETMGATKRIVFMPDMKNICHVNQVLSNLQLFIADNISKYGINNKSNNDNNNNRILTSIFCNISAESSLLKSNCNLKIGPIESLYDEAEKNYIDQLVANYSNYSNYNKDDNKSNNIKCDLTDQQLIRQMSDVAYAIFKKTKNLTNNDRKIMFNGIDLNKNISISQITEDDFKIDYRTWRANSKIEKLSILNKKTVYLNHYTYHNYCNWSTLNYDIELDRKKFHYPKMYNIDYDYVEKIYRYRCKEFVIRLKHWETRYWNYNGRIDQLMGHPRQELDAIISNFSRTDHHRHVYDNLVEFYDFNCDQIRGWKRHIPRECKVTRCTQNIQDYDLPNYYNGCDNNNYDAQDFPTALIANMDRMYCIKLDRIIEKWYKNGKYFLYRVLPHDDNQETSLSIDFCHFQIYYNRLKLLENVNVNNVYKLDEQYIRKCTWIALNDCSRYCKDEFYRSYLFEQEKFGKNGHADELQTLFLRNDKATWDRINKNNYATNCKTKTQYV